MRTTVVVATFVASLSLAMANQGRALENTASAPVVSLTNTPTVLEADRIAKIRIELDRPAASEVSVVFFTQPLSALPGRDFLGFTRTVTFAPGDVVRTIEVEIRDDLIYEEPESMAVRIISAEGAQTGTDRSVINIIDDDPFPRLGVFFYSDVDEGFNPEACVPRVGEKVRCRDSQIYIDVEGGSEREIEVTVFTTDDTARQGRDYYGFAERVVIPPFTNFHVLNMKTVQDNVPEPEKYFFVQLVNPVGAVVAQPEPTRIKLIDDDNKPKIWIQTNKFVEGAAPVNQVEIRLDRPSNVDIRTVVYTDAIPSRPDPQATGRGQDYRGFTREVVIPAGELSTAIDIVIVDDDIAEEDEVFWIFMPGQVEGANVKHYGTGSLMTIIDND